MYDLIIRILRPSLIRRSVNLVSAVRIEGSNFNQWLSVIEIQTNFCFIFGRCKAWYERVQQHQVVTLRQVVIPWFEHLEYLKKHDTQARSIRGGLGGTIPLLGFSRFWVCFQMFIYILFGSRLFNESAPFHFQLSKNCWVA